MELVEGAGNTLPSESPPLAPASAAVRLVVVDSDTGFTHVLVKRFGAVGWRTDVLVTAPPVEDLVTMRINAVVIDLGKLGAEAWSYLERLCTGSPEKVVIVCTGPSSVAQRVRGLRLGADDWISKPCHPEEVLARAEAALRRRGAHLAANETAAPMVGGELEVRPDMFEAYVGGRPVGLTRREFELLQLLAASQGRVLPREHVYERIWGYAMVPGDRSVDVFVRKLRRKLEAASPGWRYLHTHFGVGYRFQAEEVTAEPPDASATLPPA